MDRADLGSRGEVVKCQVYLQVLFMGASIETKRRRESYATQEEEGGSSWESDVAQVKACLSISSSIAGTQVDTHIHSM